MCVSGQLLAFLSNAFLGTIWGDSPHIWRWMLVLGIVPAFGLLLGTWAVVPESPRWLIATDRYEQALSVLKSIRSSEAQAKNELEEVNQLVEEDRKLHDNASLFHLLTERLQSTIKQFKHFYASKDGSGTVFSSAWA